MKSHDSIDTYLDDLRRRVARVPGGDDIADEAEDHLRASAASLCSTGFSQAEAERRAVAHYGTPANVAREFKRSSRQGGAVATRFTHLGGAACMALPVLFVAGLAGNRGPRGEEPWHAIGITAQALLYPALIVGVLALIRRHGGLGRAGWVAVAVLVISPLLVMPFSYAGLAIFVVIYAVVFGILAVLLFRAAILPRPAVLAFFGAPLAYALGALIVTLAGGDAGHAWGVPVAMLLVGFAWFGWAMWSEETLVVSQRPARA